MKNIYELLKENICTYSSISGNVSNEFKEIYESTKLYKSSKDFAFLAKEMNYYYNNIYSSFLGDISKDEEVVVFIKDKVIVNNIDLYDVKLERIFNPNVYGCDIFMLALQEIIKERTEVYFYKYLFDFVSGGGKIINLFTKDYIDYLNNENNIIMYKYTSPNRKITYIKGKIECTIKKKGNIEFKIVDLENNKICKITENRLLYYNVAFSEDHLNNIKEYYKNMYIKNICNKIVGKELVKEYYEKCNEKVKKSIEELEENLLFADEKFNYLFEI